MIKIKRGNSVLTVTAGAYQNFYKHLGYEPVGVAKSSENLGEGTTHSPDESQQPKDSTHLEDDEEDLDDEDEENGLNDEEEDEEDEEVALSEIPLSEMGLAQLYAYAEELGLDYEGIRSKKEMRALIREHLS